MEKLSFNIGDAYFGGAHFLRTLGGVGSLATALLSNAIVIAGIILIFLIIISGIQMISSAGNPEKVGQARQIITTGILGFILIVAAYFIVKLVDSTLGIGMF